MPKVHVPQADGEITLRAAGAEPVTYKVTDHEVTGLDADVDLILSQVDGSKIASGSPAATKKEN